LITYDKRGPSGYFDVWTIRPDGTDDRCLTCDAQELPPLNKGNPEWSPDGRFIAFQVQEVHSALGVDNDILDFPGSGWNNDLWLMDASGTKFWRVTNVPEPQGGVIYPIFSWSGKEILWSQRLSSSTKAEPWGTWELELGDFVVSLDGVPSVQNVRTFRPGVNQGYYEPHAFSRDDTTIFFMGNLQPGMNVNAMDIYSFDLRTQQLTDLTTNAEGSWNEYPSPFPSETDKIVYMSTTDTGRTLGHAECDLWVMNYDGSDKQRLTFLNDPQSPDYVPDGVCTDDNDFNADGTRLAVYYNPGLGPRNNVGPDWILDVARER
jgi:Tol biopolymer transport system component